MSTYLPVLLISVNNAVPDDAAVSTLPRGQVDYLSHDWREEDVWRSWREMTRQKNEIANGVRLENASWRTWWKQRNGLKTISPETLNWLKDSDVTWLYGPLHTDDDWKPIASPLKGPSAPGTPDPSTHPSAASSPASSGFDPSSINKHILSAQMQAHGMNRVLSGSHLPSTTSSRSSTSSTATPRTTKPILKHRSVVDLLTSALPIGGALERNAAEEVDAEVDASGLGGPVAGRYNGYADVGVGSSISGRGVSIEGGAAPSSSHVPYYPVASSSSASASNARGKGLRSPPLRPPLTHTKSESTIDGHGHLNPFRKESPPRVPHLPLPSTHTLNPPDSPSAAFSDSTSITTPSSSIGPSFLRRTASSSGGSAESSDRRRPGHDGRSLSSNTKKKHITFNTFVEQCIAIDSPREVKITSSSSPPPVNGLGITRWQFEADDHGYEEDNEGYSYFDVSPDAEDVQLFPESSVVYPQSPGRGINKPKGLSDSDDDDDDDDDDDMIQMRRPPSLPSFRRPRSRSTSSSTSPPHVYTPSSSHPNGLNYRLHRPPHASTPMSGRPPLIRNSTSDGSNSADGSSGTTATKEHVTIAPIAPTMLKTGPVGLNEGYSAVSFGHGQDDALDGWFERKGRMGNGLGGRWDENRRRRRRSGGPGFSVSDDEEAKDAFEEGHRSVELVYSPPVGSNYNPMHPTHFASSSPPQNILDVPTIGIVDATPSSFSNLAAGSSQQQIRHSGMFVHSPERSSPLRESILPDDDMGDEIVQLEDVSNPYDYFPGQDIGKELGSGRSKMAGAPSLEGGSVDDALSSVNLPLGDPSSNASSSTHTTTTAIPVPLPRKAPSPDLSPHLVGNPSTSSALLSPPSSSLITRGRPSATAITRCSSSSPTNLSPSDSPSPSRVLRGRSSREAVGAETGRGRSLTRTPSFSDREHSRDGGGVVPGGVPRSRSSSRTGSGSQCSPIGSLSPSGSRLGIGGGRRGSTENFNGSAVVREERGRPSAVRRVSESMSPPSPASTPVAVARGRQPSGIARAAAMPRSPTIPEGESPPLPTPSPPTAAAAAIPVASIAIPQAEVIRSAQPTPANSPTSPTHVKSASSGSGSPTRKGSSRPVPIRDSGRRHPRVPSGSISMPGEDDMHDESGLISRAVEIVSSARGYLGSFWAASNATGNASQSGIVTSPSAAAAAARIS